MADQLIGKPQRQVGESPDVDRNHAELFVAAPFGGMAENAESSIVDDVFDLDVFLSERRGDPVAARGLFEVAGNENRALAAPRDDFARQRFEPLRAPRHQGDPMTVRREHPRQLRTYSSRGTGNQRHALSHDSKLLK